MTYNHIMKNICWISLLLAIMVITGCNNKTKTLPPSERTSEMAVADTTIYGKCGESTAMHTLELVIDKGDTIMYSLENADTFSNVQGGLFIGDHLAVIAERNTEGGLFAKKVINLTSLIGKWGSLDKSFEICEGGTVISDFKEPQPYTEWKILNGKLLLSADTFDIYALGPDSLLLENSKGIFGYKRFPKEVGGRK